MTVEQASAILLSVFEGPFKLEAYQDSGGVWTIGKGHTPSFKGQKITMEQAVADFAQDQKPLLSVVGLLNKPVLAKAAYVSFGYNCGLHNLVEVLAGRGSMADPVHTTDRHGVVQHGLVSRRALEIMLVDAA